MEVGATEWVKPHWDSRNYLSCYAAGIPRELRIIFVLVQVGLPPIIRKLEPAVTYRAFYYDPTNGKEYPLGIVKPNVKGEWIAPLFPIFQDRILVLEKEKSIREVASLEEEKCNCPISFKNSSSSGKDNRGRNNSLSR